MAVLPWVQHHLALLQVLGSIICTRRYKEGASPMMFAAICAHRKAYPILPGRSTCARGRGNRPKKSPKENTPLPQSAAYFISHIVTHATRRRLPPCRSPAGQGPRCDPPRPSPPRRPALSASLRFASKRRAQALSVVFTTVGFPSTHLIGVRPGVGLVLKLSLLPRDA